MIVRIEQASDPRLAPFRDVGNPHALESAGLFLAEGRLVVQRLIEDGRFPIHAMPVTDAARDALSGALDPVSAAVYVCDQRIVHAITGFNFHRGCLALGRRVPSAVST